MAHRLKIATRGLTLLELLVVLVILLAISSMLIPAISWIGERSQQVMTQDNLVRLRELLINKYVPDMGELPRPRSEITGTPTVGTARVNHPQLIYLFVNPDYHDDGDTTNDFLTATNALAARRWQGPYITHSGAEYFVTDSDTDPNSGTNYVDRYGLGDATTRVGDPTIIDAWGQPIVIQEPNQDSNFATGPTEIERQHTRIVSPGKNGRIDTPPDVLMPTKVQRVDDVVLFLFRHDEYGDDHLDLQP